ncbi:uroporphyrinogen decarboxylase [Ehrlichia ruminantium]|uniref:uroporphyrinogen decarboxylase n=1 Tax=Ehrlichia ruminantium TaxID=779 RepID=UPI0007C13D24|nr:uroporphyrinogen decarboxylase [Ehrlichia ruminantium]QLK51943.1 uroporphyrinogen decarboxylase [Ehrlichia ruminantium]QLK53775.1 uroporphyrinogen decarboxylase [Ehrlichia ruminantium]QLK56528.1 uroporphyrinogen decarboxylase [Ehrlichia ruminantium]GAT76780.1 uroporphyrinogen decarboxylase [Ehrlichia ruminantium]
MLKTIESKTRQKNIPIWFMRQAGRYLPEYQKIAKNAPSFLEMCYNPEIVKEITLQPIERFNLDAAIIFSDILVIPDALGCKVTFTKDKGPELKEISSYQEINNISNSEILSHLSNVFQSIKEVRQCLHKDKALIGFAGGPWTVATYMIGRDKNFSKIKEMCYIKNRNLEKIIDKITEVTISYLIKQIESGVNVLQIFDSNAGVLSCEEFERWIINPTKEIISSVRKTYPDFPFIGFPKGAGVLYKKFTQETNVSVTSVDYSVPMSWAKENIPSIIQGNIDPYLLAYDKEGAISQAKKIINTMKEEPLIFNLGHGIIPSTPVENVQALVEFVKSIT